MRKWLFAIVVPILFASCEEQKPAPIVNTILPFGASRVQGSPPGYHSYRYKLWKKLRNNDWAVDFVGTQIDSELYPLFNDEEFDAHHEGHSGWTSGQLLDYLPTVVSTLIDTPQVVLFSSPGGNDAIDGLTYESAIENVHDIVKGFQEYNPDVTIVIEKMAPGVSWAMMGNLGTYHTRLLNEIDSIAAHLTTPTSEVLVIDMATGFSDSLLADPIHYNQEGAGFIATRYYDLLETLLKE